MDGISTSPAAALSALYDDIEAPLPTPQLLYKDYCLSLEGLNGSAGLAASAEYQASRAFWWQRVRELPPPPQLPLAAADGEAPRATGRFDHLGGVLSASQLSQLRANCAAAGVTPTAVMLTIYAPCSAGTRGAATLCSTSSTASATPSPGRHLGDRQLLFILPPRCRRARPSGSSISCAR